MKEILRKDVKTGEMINIAGHCPVKSIKIEWYNHIIKGDYKEIEKMAKLYSTVNNKKYYYVYSIRNNPVYMFDMKLLKEVFTDYVSLLEERLKKLGVETEPAKKGNKYARTKSQKYKKYQKTQA